MIYLKCFKTRCLFIIKTSLIYILLRIKGDTNMTPSPLTNNIGILRLVGFKNTITK
jgi:hypothetical protein